MTDAQNTSCNKQKLGPKKIKKYDFTRTPEPRGWRHCSRNPSDLIKQLAVMSKNVRRTLKCVCIR